LALLETIEAVGTGLTLTELVHRLDESQTVVFRLLRTLEERGYVQQDATTKRYRLGLRVWEMGAKAMAWIGLVDVARPVLKWLTRVTGETSGLVVLRDADVLYVDIAEGSEPLRVYAEVGQRAPAYATASGKAMLAHHPEVLPQVVQAGLKRLTPSTITRVSELKRQLAEIRRTGLSVNYGERRDDIAAVAAPIFDRRGECVAAASLSGPRTRLNGEALEELKRHVRKAAEEISSKLGYRESNRA
jgi:DNA-binding IclR family transcriptional regulator